MLIGKVIQTVKLKLLTRVFEPCLFDAQITGTIPTEIEQLRLLRKCLGLSQELNQALY